MAKLVNDSNFITESKHMTKIPHQFDPDLRRDLMEYYREEYFQNCIIPTMLKFDLPISIQRLGFRTCRIKLTDTFSLYCNLPRDIYLPISYWDGGKYATQREIVGMDDWFDECKDHVIYDTTLTTKKGFGLETMLEKDKKLCYCEELNYGDGIQRFFNSQSFYEEVRRLMVTDWNSIEYNY